MCNSNCNCNNTPACHPCKNVYYDYVGFKCVTNPCVILSSQPDSSKAKYIKKYGIGYDCFDKCNNLVNNNECKQNNSGCGCGCGCECESTTEPSTSSPCDCGCDCATTIEPSTSGSCP